MNTGWMATFALMLMTTTAMADTWGVTWQGEVNKKYYHAPTEGPANTILQDGLSKVLGTTVKAGAWGSVEADHLFLITDASQGPADLAKKLEGKKADAFVIAYPVEIEGRKVCVLMSKDDKAYDYPVYHFLTKFMNMHWVGPGELGEVYDVNPDWQMPATIDVVENPAFQMRLWTGSSFSSRPWLARSGRMGFHHALGYIFSPEKYAKSNPEVYPLIDGKRFVPELDGVHSAGWQPCLFGEKSIEIAVAHVKEHLSKGAVSVSLSVNDGAGNHCQCDLCTAQDAKSPRRSAWDLSDRYFRWYNLIIEKVLPEYPDAYVAALAYGPCSKPPMETKVNPHVLIFKVAATPQDLKDWHAVGATPNLYLWLWEGGFLTFRPNMNVVADLVRSCHDMGGIGMYSEIIANWVFSAPKFYVLAKVLWDTSNDADEALAEYCNLTYGKKAGPSVFAYFQRWYAIYDRFENPYSTQTGWRNDEQFKHLTSTDLLVLDDAIASAAAAAKSGREAERFAFLTTWHDWLMTNANQYIAARDLADGTWLDRHSNEGILARIDETAGLTAKFNAIWTDTIYEDKTGWLLDSYYNKDSKKSYWDLFLGQLRTVVDSEYETNVAESMTLVTQRLLESGDKDAAMKFWNAQLSQRPALKPYVDSQVRRLNGETFANVVINGSFEDSADAPDSSVAPRIEGWDTYQEYGMVHGQRSTYSLKKGTGRYGNVALGMGEGTYTEVRSFCELQEGRRYLLTYWYRSENRDSPFIFNIFRVNGELGAVRPDVTSFYARKLDSTGGEWKKESSILVANQTGKFMIMVMAYHNKAGEWLWLDDVEIKPY